MEATAAAGQPQPADKTASKDLVAAVTPSLVFGLTQLSLARPVPVLRPHESRGRIARGASGLVVAV